MLAAMALSMIVWSVLGVTGSLPGGMVAGIELPLFDPYIPLPFGIKIFTWYGFSYLMGFLVGFLILDNLRKAGRSPIGKEQLIEFVLWQVLFIMVAGRVGYFVLYERARIGDLFNVTSVAQACQGMFGGGRSFHGALVGVALAVALVAYRWRLSFGWIGDYIALAAAPGLFFGRLGNFINQELWGREAPAALPWAMKFYTEALKASQPQFEAQVATSAKTAMLFGSTPQPPGNLFVIPQGIDPQVWTGFLTQIEKVYSGNLSSMGRAARMGELQLMVHNHPALQRVMEDVLAFQHTLAQEFMAQIPYRHPSQLYNALGEGLILGTILWLQRSKLTAYKGYLTGQFLLWYGVIRFVLEFFREPDRLDNGRPYYVLGLISLGQLYCLPMILLGVVVCALAVNRGKPTPADQRRMDWAATGDEEQPPAETYAEGAKPPANTLPIAQKIALYERRVGEKKMINPDGEVTGKLSKSELDAVDAVLPKLRSVAAKWQSASADAR